METRRAFIRKMLGAGAALLVPAAAIEELLAPKKSYFFIHRPRTAEILDVAKIDYMHALLLKVRVERTPKEVILTGLGSWKWQHHDGDWIEINLNEWREL